MVIEQTQRVFPVAEAVHVSLAAENAYVVVCPGLKAPRNSCKWGGREGEAVERSGKRVGTLRAQKYGCRLV